MFDEFRELLLVTPGVLPRQLDPNSPVDGFPRRLASCPIGRKGGQTPSGAADKTAPPGPRLPRAPGLQRPRPASPAGAGPRHRGPRTRRSPGRVGGCRIPRPERARSAHAAGPIGRAALRRGPRPAHEPNRIAVRSSSIANARPVPRLNPGFEQFMGVIDPGWEGGTSPQRRPVSWFTVPRPSTARVALSTTVTVAR